MENDNFFKKSNFTDKWVNLGIITPEVLEKLKIINKEEASFNDEHQRWRAFTIFLERNKNLSPEIMKALYELGSIDRDEMMGGSMMRALLDRKDCPLEILESASKSDKEFLMKAANRAILRRIAKS